MARLIQKADELYEKLRLLLEALEHADRVVLKSSPFLDVLGVIGDLLEHASLMAVLRRPYQALASPGLKFVEHISVPEPSESEFLNSRIFYDPVESKDYYHSPSYVLDKDPKYYKYQADPLGNPLQVKISFDPIGQNLSDSDRRSLQAFFEELARVFAMMAAGRMDWQFMRQFNRFFRGISAPEMLKTKHHSKSVNYRMRKAKQRKGRQIK